MYHSPFTSVFSCAAKPHLTNRNRLVFVPAAKRTFPLQSQLMPRDCTVAHPASLHSCSTPIILNDTPPLAAVPVLESKSLCACPADFVAVCAQALTGQAATPEKALHLLERRFSVGLDSVSRKSPEKARLPLPAETLSQPCTINDLTAGLILLRSSPAA